MFSETDPIGSYMRMYVRLIYDEIDRRVREKRMGKRARREKTRKVRFTY